MNVPSVIPTSAVTGAVSIQSAQPLAGADVTPSHKASATATISPLASLLNRLQALADGDPAGLTAVAGQIASTAHAAASRASGDEKASLTKFGEALAQVAKDGDVAALRRTHHHHAHPAKHLNGGTGALLNNLLQNIDTVLGPNASPSAQT